MDDTIKRGTLKNGFEFAVDVEILDDMELIDTIAEADEGNPAKFKEATDKILGKEQKKSLYDHLRNEKGKVPIEAFKDAFMEILESIGDEGKN